MKTSIFMKTFGFPRKCWSMAWTIMLVVLIHLLVMWCIFIKVLEIKNEVRMHKSNSFKITKTQDPDLYAGLEKSLSTFFNKLEKLNVKVELDDISGKLDEKFDISMYSPSTLRIHELESGDNCTLVIQDIILTNVKNIKYSHIGDHNSTISFSCDNKLGKQLENSFDGVGIIYKKSPLTIDGITDRYSSFTLNLSAKDIKLPTELIANKVDMLENIPSYKVAIASMGLSGDTSGFTGPLFNLITLAFGVILIGLNPFIKEKMAQIYKCQKDCSRRVFLISSPLIILLISIGIFFNSASPVTGTGLQYTCLVVLGVLFFLLIMKKFLGFYLRRHYILDHAHRCKTTEEMLAVVNDFQRETMRLNNITTACIEKDDHFDLLKTHNFFDTSDILQQADVICNSSKKVIKESTAYEADSGTDSLQELNLNASNTIKEISIFDNKLSMLVVINANLKLDRRNEKKLQSEINKQITRARCALSKLERQQKMVLQDITTPIRKRTSTGLTSYSNINKAT